MSKVEDLSEFGATPIQTEAPKAEDLSEFGATPIQPAPTAEKQNAGLSGLLGLGQGATLGFGDELAGGAGALIDAARKGSLGDLKKDYQTERDFARGLNATAHADHPVWNGAGQLIGGVASAGVTGGNSIGAMTGLGALQGLGNSQADLTKGQFGRAAADTALGGALGATGGIVGKLIGAGGQAAGKQAGEVIAPKLAAAEENIALPGKVKALQGQLEELMAQKGASVAEKQAARMAALKEAAQVPDEATLRQAAMANLRDKAEADIASKTGELGKRSQEVMRAFEVLQNPALEGTPLAAQAKELMASSGAQEIFQNAAKQKLESFPGQIGKVQGLRGELADLIGNKEANIAGGTEGEAQRLLQAAQEKSTAAAQKATDLERNTQIRGLREQLKTVLPQQDTVFGKLAQQVQADRLKTLGGTLGYQHGHMLGEATGIPFAGPVLGTAGAWAGSKLGSAAAPLATKLAPQVAKTGWSTVNALVSTTPQLLGKFAPQLTAAAARSPDALAAAHFVLQQTSPQYRELMKSHDDSLNKPQEPGAKTVPTFDYVDYAK